MNLAWGATDKGGKAFLTFLALVFLPAFVVLQIARYATRNRGIF